ncbi:type IV secretory system conjugative DNA transfer family protein [Streptomyces sanyensis]|uniref:Type IV secretory system conjugative DNA transfer family protein n=1 Tax=Streptomyces sanyensis TaxID=568869 RepID=A0ABP9ABB5_9ACTN
MTAGRRAHDGQAGGGAPQGRAPGGGIPDGLLVALLAAVIGFGAVVWTGTGLAGLLAHGSWPNGVSYTGAPGALRSLVGSPQDLAAAWPDAPPAQLSGYGLFWGLVIGQVMLLVVLAVFALGTLARWRAVRAAARAEKALAGPRHEAGVPSGPDDPAHGVAVPAHTPPRPGAEGVAGDRMEAPSTAATAHHAAAATHPTAVAGPPRAAPTTGVSREPAAVPGPRAPAAPVLYGDASARREAAVRALLDADGPALVTTSDPAVWSETKDTRAKLGPVLVYDPGHLCDTPSRVHWSPAEGCEDAARAAARATALLAPVRPHALADAAMADTAETLLRCWLHAAAIDGRPFRQVHRWAQGTSAQDPVRILRTHPRAAGGLAGLLESALTAHPERRDIATQLTSRALSALSSVHIREACTAHRTDSLALESFVNEAGTLYVVGEAVEDPRTRPGAVPLLTALVADVVERGRRVAERSSGGRLDPPLTLVLDDIAAVAPVPLLPWLLTDGRSRGLPTLALLRSPEQGRSRWPGALSGR